MLSALDTATPLKLHSLTAKKQMATLTGKAVGACVGEEFGKTFKKQAAVIIVKKNVPPLNSANDNML